MATRILAVDLGDVRTGLAVSDPGGILCGAAWTIKPAGMRAAAQTIVTEAQNRGCAKIILGLPLNMDDTEGERAAKSRRLKAMLEALCDIPVILWDERLTTVEAHEILREAGKKSKKHKGIVDAVAASLILEGYLNQ